MAKFYIEKLVVTGNGRKPSVIEFCDGLNFIVGPSNTGKSRVVDCIDYLFGFEPTKNKPFLFDPALGYDRFTLFTRTPNGTVVLERKLGENKITLSGTDPNFEHGKYSLGHTAKYNISSVWLQMIGVDTPHKILSSQSGKTQQLTWRSILHMFFIKQDFVSRTQSVLYNPDLPPNLTATPSKAAVLFLMTGKDANQYEVTEDKRIRTAKKTAVIEYIRDTVSRFASRESELLNSRSRLEELNPLSQDHKINDLRTEVDTIKSDIDSLQRQINMYIAQSRQLMSEIYSYNGRLAECETISDNFSALRSQYQSDINRLTFVIDGNASHTILPKLQHCPFCDSEISVKEYISYIDTARAELNHIRIHLTELEKAERDISAEQNSIVSTVNKLELQKRNIDLGVSQELTPQLTQLKEKLSFYKYIIEINKELEVIREEERKFNSELFLKETEEEPSDLKYDINQFFDAETIQSFQEKLISILQACHFEGSGSARINMNIFDLEISGRVKALSNGGGYCGLLNTILAIALIEFLEENGEYSPGFLIVDSPITQLSESAYKEKKDTLISGLLKYLVSIYDSDSMSSSTSAEQIIIIEHKDKLQMLDDISGNSNHVKVIEFTKDKQHGRYGFLEGVYQYE